MDVFVINEKAMAGNEEQAAAEAALLLNQGAKVIFILAEQIPAAQAILALRKIDEDTGSVSNEALRLLSFSGQVSKSLNLCSKLVESGLKAAFCQGFFSCEKLPERLENLEIFLNMEEIENLIMENRLLIVAPLKIKRDLQNIEDFISDIEAEQALSAVSIVKEAAGFEIFIDDEEDNGKISLDILEKIAEAKISLDMINICYKELYFISSVKDADKAEAIITTFPVKYSLRKDLAKFSFSGTGIKGATGIMDGIYGAFIEKNIDMIRTTDSHTTISCLIERDKIDDGIKASVEYLNIPSSNVAFE